LGDDNACSVYDDRPKACREFPHTNHRKMHTHLALAQHNIEICPAVFAIVEQLKA
jgi:Fe-S-cluster containining protein